MKPITDKLAQALRAMIDHRPETRDLDFAVATVEGLRALAEYDVEAFAKEVDATQKPEAPSAQPVDVLAWQVTYLNALDGRRHVLVDKIDEATADAVVARFGDKRNRFEYLPEVRKERAAALARVQGGQS